MGNCIFCDRPVGLFHREHKECRARHDNAVARIPNFFKETLTSSLSPERFRELTDEIAKSAFIRGPEYPNLITHGFAEMIDSATSDKVLAKDEEDRIDALLKAFGLKLTDLPEDSAYRVAKGSILRQLDDGKLPTSLPTVKGYNPINLRRNEKIVWVFNDTSYLSPRTKTEYVGGSHGVSVRVMKGVYYRAGAFKGTPIQKDYLKTEGVGDLVLSNQNVYFISPAKSLKIPMRKIISIEPSATGLVLGRDGASAKPAIFIVDDPWFAANAISRLSQIDSS